MEILLDDSTGNLTEVRDMVKMAQDYARICYSELTLDEIHREGPKPGLVSSFLENGHHSPFDHPTLNLDFRGIPKIGAMILNNERPNSTSEKSARYTKMKLEPRQKELYEKWMKIFEKEITTRYPEDKYPKMYAVRKEGDPAQFEKLAQENARYLTSIDTPTFMGHTLSLRKLNEAIHSYERSIEELPDTRLNRIIKSYMQEFLESPVIQSLRVPNLRHKANKLISLVADRDDYAEEFGENFSVNYEQTFAYLAQAHRHRTLNYNIQQLSDNPDDLKFYIPPIIKENPDLVGEWVKDMREVAQDDIPQGTMIQIHENGNLEEFVWKAYERLCGNAQLEIMQRTKETLDKYIAATKETNPAVHKILTQYENGPRCTFPNHQCDSKCAYGPKESLVRTI